MFKLHFVSRLVIWFCGLTWLGLLVLSLGVLCLDSPDERDVLINGGIVAFTTSLLGFMVICGLEVDRHGN